MEGIFGLTTPFDLFRKLERDLDLMQRDPGNQDFAINFFMTAEHMVDWLYPGYENTKKRTEIRDSEVLLQVTSHLANGTKHFQVQAKHHKSVAKTGQTGYFATGYFAKGYFSEWLCVELSDTAADELGKSIRVNDLAKRVLEYWKNHLSTYDGR